ncbi:MAG: peptidylprolyl isomerase [Oscillospiraceae bacterium]|nr:peptidylprolyl isomerase [Oscillospiraceae bacterium]
MKKTLTAAVIIAILLMVSGCSFFDMPRNPIWDYDYSEMRLIQLEPPKEGQPIVTVYTAFGEFTAMLFPEYAPNTVENFIARVNDGFYDNKPILTLIQHEFFLTGALNDEGTQGVTSDGNLIENEYSVNLWPFKGSLLAFSGRQGFGDSRFLILGSVPFSDELAEEMSDVAMSDGTVLFPPELISAFSENGNITGAIGLYTIFGQIIDGLDVLDELLSAETDEETKRPVEEILIEKIILSEYSENRAGNTEAE